MVTVPDRPLHPGFRFERGEAVSLDKGWYLLSASGLSEYEEVEVQLDFGLGFVGYHTLRITADDDQAKLYARLFKPVRRCRLRWDSEAAKPAIRFERVGRGELLRRRAIEQLHLALKWFTAARRHRFSPHDRPRRLWGWRGLLAFRASLPATGESSYALWRRCQIAEPNSVSTSGRDWLLVLDCRRSEPSPAAVDAFEQAAKAASARCLFLRSGTPTTRDIDWGNARWHLVVQPDVLIDRVCLEHFAAAAEDSEARVIYCDNDHLHDGRRHLPEFRTRFSSERLKSQDWLGDVVAVRSDTIGRAGYSSEELHDLCRAIEQKRGPLTFAHIPEVLYSRLSSPRARREQGRRTDRPSNGKTSIIIPTRNKPDLLQRCIDGIMTRTDGGLPEIIIHDNGSDDPAALALLDGYAGRNGFRVLRDDAPFNFSRINNDAAAASSGDVLIFLNNDTEVVSSDWITRLAGVATDPEVGCAGPLLLGPDGTIQHAGLATGPGGIAFHLHFGLRPDQADPAFPIVRRDISAVTGACMAVEKRKFMAVGGFDAKGLAVSFNDVDLCLRLEGQGLRNVFVPEVQLIHLGSATREDDDFTTGSERFRAEFMLMRDRWGERLDNDPYVPRHLRLTSAGAQLRLA